MLDLQIFEKFDKAGSISSNIREKGLEFIIVAFQKKTLSEWALSRFTPLDGRLFTYHTTEKHVKPPSVKYTTQA